MYVGSIHGLPFKSLGAGIMFTLLRSKKKKRLLWHSAHLAKAPASKCEYRHAQWGEGDTHKAKLMSEWTYNQVKKLKFNCDYFHPETCFILCELWTHHHINSCLAFYKFNDFFFIHPKGLGTQLLYWLPKKLNVIQLVHIKVSTDTRNHKSMTKLHSNTFTYQTKTHLSKSKQWNTDVTQKK